MSLIWPVILALWATWIVILLARKDENGLWWHERKLGLTAGSGWAHEFKRLGAFIVMFQVTCLLVVTLPPMITRILFGAPSLLVP